MAAPIGNDYWKIRTKHGRDKIFKTPLSLLNKCNEYFAWVVANPLLKEDIVNKQWTELVEYQDTDDSGNTITKTKRITHPYSRVTVSLMRAFTLEGLCNYIDLSVKGFELYENREDFMQVTTRVRQIIYNQKFEGAAAGLLQHNIIARDLGLADKKTHEIEEVQIKGIKFSD